MLMSGTLRRLLLAGTCLCIYGNPVHLQDSTPTQDRVTSVGPTQTPDVKSESTSAEHVTGLMLDVGAAGGADPHEAPVGSSPVTQTENGDGLDGRSGLGEAGGEAPSQKSEEKKVGSTSEMGDALRQSERAAVLPVEEDTAITSGPTGGKKQMDIDQTPTARRGRDRGGEDLTNPPAYAYSVQGKNPETDLLFSTEPPNPGETTQKLPSHSPIFVSPQTLTPLSIWSQDGATTSSLPEPLLPEFGPNLMPKEDGPESLWTEAVRPGGVNTEVPLSQDEATEGTMSSEALPLIFEPFEDVASEGAPADAAVTSMPGSAQPLAAMATAGMDVDPQLVTVETDSDSLSQAPPLLMPDWTSPWQTSGAEQLEPISSSGPSVSQQRAGSEAEDHTGREEQDEDEDDENSEESVEDESEEDLTETPKTSSTPPPYSLIPPPPVWVQRNQGLMRSWVELIREKAGYVSGMLAPVGIGITGALLIVGALYSIRMIHRKRRNSFKHQRRKQPREPGTSRQDQAMLLADSSEDEF
ncbi:uncharacterized protein LOC117824038 isoform X2 [Xyrichtys novacula]|uniref:Uncharacterized protein LOC117824038 isoform X2 n=1 Tax=Xyrichtys novacula TaxID=13765 RepID=A0AAV1GU90_XYRNO|nr:uncharacterized protein LOC117824038 isoform X2 [Xyrichtys novacula]